MKKIHYNSRLAKLATCVGTCDTITLGPWIFTEGGEISQTTKNHESTHVAQWVELTLVAGLLVMFAVWALNAPLWSFLLPPVVFYAIYLAEWLIRFIWALFVERFDFAKANKRAYLAISFEQEANAGERDDTYNENRDYFASFKFWRVWK